MTLTKAHIVDRIRDEIGFTRNECTELVETFLELIKGTFESGEDVLISGFGKSCLKQKRERRGRNPATGDELILASRKVVTFQCSEKLRGEGDDRRSSPFSSEAEMRYPEGSLQQAAELDAESAGLRVRLQSNKHKKGELSCLMNCQFFLLLQLQ